jgi:hypothetical protein
MAALLKGVRGLLRKPQLRASLRALAILNLTELEAGISRGAKV